MDNSVKDQLMQLADADYQKFTAALIPNINNILGIRLPQLRQLAKEIAKGDWRAYLELAEPPYEWFEETMLHGMIIGHVKTDLEDRLKLITDFVPLINNWSVCDSFCSGLKFTRKHKERVWEFLQPYLASDQEYEIRFGVVMLLNYYIEDAYIAEVLQLLDRIQHEGYYVKMAVAWAVSICYIKLPEPTMDYLKHNSLEDFTYNKALQKITESLRIDQATKALIRSMKRK